MKTRITIWAVHIYRTGKPDRPGKYLRTIDATFTESSGRAFCKVFNACGGKESTREEGPGVVAVVKEHAVEVSV